MRSPEEREQARLKADLMAEQWAAIGVDGVALRSTDWDLGREALLSIVQQHELPVLAGNLICDGAAPFPGHRVVEVGGHRVGLVGITQGTIEGCDVSAAAPSLQASVAALGQVDLVVGLLPVTHRDIAAWGVDDLGIDVAITASGSARTGVPEAVAGLWPLSVPPRGKYIGVVELQFNQGADGWKAVGAREELAMAMQRTQKQLDAARRRKAKAQDGGREQDLDRLQAQIGHYESKLSGLRADVEALDLGRVSAQNTLRQSQVALSTAVGEHTATNARVQVVKQAVSEVELAKASVSGSRIGPEGSPYAGADVCQQCHPAISRQWNSTRHADALQSLVAEHREGDGECVGCHATGYQLPGGPTRPREVAGLRDVQCEACHGPSAAHALDPKVGAMPIRVPQASTCTACHDGERDEGRFDLKSYMRQVGHRDDGRAGTRPSTP